ncbi:MAG TPA: hypothetical protein PLL30_00290 [Candidatus Krumholzibacteria bacterium]|nr:hypothetical protein [Candidatus Krumholzibacteria bacterium]HPD70197.1 hypothetical protein [Candidatus Krumholzibacteria bacterium]HRY40103.1 hypothetical protein [Candidatus Krumholzibacteria bacterium]
MIRCAMLAFALIVSAAAAAHDLTGPASVVADAAGHFAYEVTLVVTSPTEFAWSEIDGSEGTDLGWQIFDGFCLETIEPGTYAIPIEGNLLDPQVPGVVHYSHFLCDGWEETVSTTIVPLSVGLEPATWGDVKSLYR